MVIEPRGIWEYSAYQTDTQFIVEVKPVKEDPNRLVQSSAPGYAGEKLSLNFQNVEVRAVLQVIADFTGLNIITSDTVGGNLTLRLKDVPWDQALDIILQAKGLSKRKNGNVVLIAPTDELAAKEKLALEAQAAVSDLEPVRTESFALSYAKAEDLKKLLSDKDQRILSKRGSATIDERTNTLFVQDTGGRLEEARRLIQQLDVPVRQVLIEARIVIADDKWGRQLGARFGTQSAFNTSNYNFGVSGHRARTPSSPLANNPVSRGSSSLTYTRRRPSSSGFTAPQVGTIPIGAQPEQLNVNLPVVGAAGQLALSILNLGSGNLVNVELSALEADNRGKVVSSPRVITADKKKAVISQGTEIPYLTAAASGATTVVVQARGARARGHAAHHAGRPHHHGPRGEEGLRRRRSSPASPRSTRKKVYDAGAGRQRRHDRAGRHLRADDAHHGRQGSVPRRPAVRGLPLQAHGQAGRQDRAARSS